jgi:hypothetical protein
MYVVLNFPVATLKKRKDKQVNLMLMYLTQLMYLIHYV